MATLCGVVDRGSDRPLYRQLADELRRQVVCGELSPGAYLPGERALEQSSDLGRGAVRRALDVLRSDGLVVSQRGRLSQVRRDRPTAVEDVFGATVVRARMPQTQEGCAVRPARWRAGPCRAEVGETVHPANRVELRIGVMRC